MNSCPSYDGVYDGQGPCWTCQGIDTQCPLYWKDIKMENSHNAESVRPHEGPTERTYHHVGTGHTESKYWCPECPGWFGVPHDLHPHGSYRKDCACVPCQKIDGRYPKHGVFMTHGYYRRWFAKASRDNDRWTPQFDGTGVREKE